MVRKIFWTCLAILFTVSIAHAQQYPPNAVKNPFGQGWLCERGYKQNNNSCIAVEIPPNAELNILGNGWTCKRGFRLLADACTAVQVPENSELNVLGNGWTCKRGFQLLNGVCNVVRIPDNAELNVLGNGWTCKRGFQLLKGVCNVVLMPENAELNVLGNGWTCRRGFRIQNGVCTVVDLPENAELDVLGTNWTCKTGFKKVGPGCQRMTAEELANYEKQLQELRARRQRTFGSGNTYRNSKGAEFTITVDNARLRCSEGFSGGFDRCRVDIDYSITTNYNGNNDPDVNVSCEANITYTDKSGFASTRSRDETDSVYLYGHDTSDDLQITFSFYSEEVVRAALRNVDCRIEDVY